MRSHFKALAKRSMVESFIAKFTKIVTNKREWSVFSIVLVALILPLSLRKLGWFLCFQREITEFTESQEVASSL